MASVTASKHKGRGCLKPGANSTRIFLRKEKKNPRLRRPSEGTKNGGPEPDRSQVLDPHPKYTRLGQN